MPVIGRPGRLTIFAGPMFAGKSTSLLSRVQAFRSAGKRALLLKPEFDTRHAADRVATHSGVSLPALPVHAWPVLADDVDVVALDEAQFFVRPFFDGHLPSIVTSLLDEGVDVLAAGLLETWRGEPFEVMRALMAIADEVVVLAATCSVCGAPAYRTAKIGGTVGSFEVGGADLYEPRCDLHWGMASLPLDVRPVAESRPVSPAS